MDQVGLLTEGESVVRTSQRHRSRRLRTEGLCTYAGSPFVLAWRGGQDRKVRTVMRERTPCRSAAHRQGFTIVELMVCISIIAILVAILLPALSRVRAQAHLTQALSGIRQVHASTFLYLADEADAMPYIATPHRPWEPIVVRGVLIQGLPYFRQSNFVLSVVARCTTTTRRACGSRTPRATPTA